MQAAYNCTIHDLGRFSLYLCLIASFSGGAFLTVGLGSIHIFPYRVLLLLLWTIFSLKAAWGYLPGLKRILALQNYFLFLALWLVYSVCYVLLVRDLTAYIKYSLFLFMGVSVIFFVVYYTESYKGLYRIGQIWFWVLIILLCIGLWENLSGHHLEVSSRDFGDMEKVCYIPTGTFVMINQYAACLTLGLPLFLTRLASTKNKGGIIFLSVGALLTLYLISETQSRISLLAILLEITTAFFWIFPRKKKLWIGGILTAVVLVTAAFNPSFYRQKADSIQLQFHSAYRQIILHKNSGKIRVNLALNGLYFLRDSGGLGVGAGNFNHYMEEKPYFSTASTNHPTRVLFPHNWWIELLSEYGIIIFILYCLFFLFILIRVLQITGQSRASSKQDLGRFLSLGLLGFPLVCMAPGYFIAFRTQWLLLAMSLAYIGLSRSGPKDNQRSEVSTATNWIDRPV